MPTYDYECTICGYKFEKFHSITAKSLQKCPKCGKKVKRLIGGGGGIIFKGAGFYQTDYRSESYKKKAAADQGPASCPKADSSKSCAACPHSGKK